MRVLVTADIHIGRRPGALRAADAARFSCANAWLGLVRTAMDQRVDALLLAGDIVDRDNQFFEALAPIEDGLKRLQEHGISVYAVSGNHDYEVLAQLAEANTAGNFHLLGRGGIWEKVLLPNAGRPEVQLFGWSFPESHVLNSPLVEFPTHRVDSHLAALGLLHADRDVSDSPYAPITSQQLAGAGAAMHWVLGHVHAPDELLSGRRTFYPGSLQGMDLGAGECGLHGPVLISMGPGSFTARRLGTMPLRYERPVFDLGVVESPEHVSACFLQAVREYVGGLTVAHSGLQVLCIRPLCRCVSRLHFEQILMPLQPLLQGSEPIVVDAVTVQVDDVEMDIRPEVNLQSLSRGGGVLGQLAQVLLAGDAGVADGNDGDGLRESIRRRCEMIGQAPVFNGLPVGELGHTEAYAATMLQSQAWRLLHELLLQRESDVGT